MGLIPKFFGLRGRALNLAISSLGSFDFLYVRYTPPRAIDTDYQKAIRL